MRRLLFSNKCAKKTLNVKTLFLYLICQKMSIKKLQITTQKGRFDMTSIYAKTHKFMQDRYGTDDGRYLSVKEHEQRFLENGEYDEGYYDLSSTVRLYKSPIHTSWSPWSEEDNTRFMEWLHSEHVSEVPGLVPSTHEALANIYDSEYPKARYLGCEQTEPACVYYDFRIPHRLVRDWWLAMDKRRTLRSWNEKHAVTMGDIARMLNGCLSEWSDHEICWRAYHPFMRSFPGVYEVQRRDWWSPRIEGLPQDLAPCDNEVAA